MRGTDGAAMSAPDVCGEIRGEWRCALSPGHVSRHAGWWRGVLREWPYEVTPGADVVSEPKCRWCGGDTTQPGHLAPDPVPVMNEPAELDLFLVARDEMIETVKHVLAQHRPERIHEKRVVTCTKVYDDEPHEVIKTQWPGWRDHVAPQIVDALFELMIPASEEPTT